MGNKLLSRLTAMLLVFVLVFTSVPMTFAGTTKTTLKITKQPKSVTVSGGTIAKVSISAKGDGLTYKWYYKNKNKSKYTLSKDFKSTIYSTQMTKERAGRKVYCVVKDKYGKTVKSNVVTLSRGTTLKVTKQPKSVTVSNGTKAKVTVAVSGDGLTYKWYYKDKGKTKYTLSKDFKGTSYSAVMKDSRAGRKIYCVIKDKYGSSVKTNVVTLHRGTTLKVTKQPKSVTVSNGTKAKLNVTAAGDGLTYKWYYKNKGKSKYTLSKDFKNTSYSVTMKDSRAGRKVYCVITDKYGSKIRTNIVTLHKGTTLKVTKQPKSVTVSKGSKAKVSFVAKGSSLSYKWYYKDKDDTKYTLSKSFKGTSYSTEMSSSKDGRKVYCIIKDKYGSKIQTKVVTLSMKKALKITKQPISVKVAEGTTAKVTVSASGNDLTYKWYYKDKDDEKYTLSKTFKGQSYSIKMNADRDGRKVYCIIQDKYGKKVQSNTVTLSMRVPLKITKQPSSVKATHDTTAKVSIAASGEGLTYTWYYKDIADTKATKVSGTSSKSYSVEVNNDIDGRKVYCVIKDKYGKSVTSKTVSIGLSHDMGEWSLIREATVDEEGITRRRCQYEDCHYYEDKASAKLDPVYYITVYVSDNEYYGKGVGKNGKYTLDNPIRKGFDFKGWQDAEGKPFSKSGVINANTTVYAVWETKSTDTMAKLIERAAEGVEEIKVTADITVDQPIYVPEDTTIYSDEDYTIKRAANYKGDMFVVGMDKNGTSSVVAKKSATLTLGKGEGTLTIDGNADELTVGVEGSAIFASESATINLYDNVKILNHKKVANKRIYTYKTSTNYDYLSKAGGAAILLYNGTINMYGGLIDNNQVVTEYTKRTDDAGAVSNIEVGCCGGAIYNRGEFNMYGGTISNNQSLRGGGVYSDRVTHLYGGLIADNVATTFGGGFASSSGADSDLFIGGDADYTMTFSNNYSMGTGGALYSNTSSPILIYGNAEFISNHADGSGGTIYTAGALTIDGATIKNSYSNSSGGAIYHYYTKADKSRRLFEVSNSTFEGNSGTLGGAIILSASSEVADKNQGTYATITNCNFIDNQAVKNADNIYGNGGAIYVTKKSEAVISDCDFRGNTAVSDGGGMSIQSNSKVQLTDINFVENTAVNGGGVYTSAGCDVALKNVKFSQNKAVLNAKNGGGIGGAVYFQNLEVPLENVDFYNNSAAGNAGAIYQSAQILNLDSTCEFDGNTAGGHGGAIYLTYTSNEDGTKNGAVLNAKGTKFNGNTALAGGAVSARTSCEANFDGCELTNNTATGTKFDAESGGAVYVGFGKATLKNVVADGNVSAGYSGVVAPYNSTVEVTDSELNNNTATLGGAIYANSKSDLKLQNVSFTGNKAVLNASNGNGHGGALYIDKVDVEMDNLDFYNNSAAGNAGAIYVNAVELNLDSAYEFDGNTAGNHGGSIYLTYKTVDDVKIGAVLNATDVTFKNGSALAGGAISARTATEVHLNGGSLTNNSATGTENDPLGGGALYVGYGKASLTDVDVSGNTSAGFGGAMNLVSATVDISGGTFENNSAPSGGAINAVTSSKVTVNGAAFNTNASTNPNTGYDNTQGGGAICVTGGTLDISKATMDGNTSAYYGGAVLANKVTVTIDENTEVKNSTGATGGALYFANGSKVTMADSSVVNNTAKSNGAIYANAVQMTMDNIAASGNKANNGGVMYISGGSTVVDITDSVWSENSGAYGGTINVKNATVNLKNVEMNKNSATKNGGAVASEAANVTYDNVDFYNNTADNYGGAIILTADEQDIDATCTFDGNTATKHGGAIYLAYKTNETDGTKTGSVLNANGVTFKNGSAAAGGAISARTDCVVNVNGGELINNTATGTTSSAEGGGAIYVGWGKATLTDVTVQGNESAGYGGVIHAAGAPLVMSNGEYTGNYAPNGGVVYATSSSDVDVDTLTFEKNSAVYGGAFNLTGSSDVTLKDVVFKENAAVLDASNAGGHGGTIYANGLEVKMDNVDFYQNSAAGNAGAIYQNGSVLNLDSTCEFDGNTAGNHGGSIYLTYKDVDGVKVGAVLTATDVTFQNGSALAGGAISARTNCEANLTNVQLLNNTATGLKNDPEGGGALYVGYGKANLTNVTAKENTSAGYGGAINFVSGTAVISDSTFEQNSAPSGGAINGLTKSKITVDGTTFKTNKSTYDQTSGEKYDNTLGGGAINTTGGTLDLSAVILDGNTTGYYGGAVHTNEATVTIDENSEVKNSTGATGAALYFNTNSTVTMKDSAVTGNTSTGNGVIYVATGSMDMDNVTATGNNSLNGGVLFASVAGTDVTLKNSEWIQNTASTGGAVYVNSAANVELNNVKLEDNNAYLGGAVYSKSGNLTLVDNVFNKNTATKTSSGSNGNGGAIVENGGKTVATGNNTFTENTAENHGGAIYVTYYTDDAGTRYNGCLEMTDGLFENNSAAVAGGAISSRTACEIAVTGTEFKANSANGKGSSEGGGAIYTNDNTATLSGVIMDGNSTGYYGGAVSALNAKVTIKDNSEIKNSIGTTGSALHFRGTGTTNLESSSVINNVGTSGSGVIYVTGADNLNMTDMTVTGNQNNNGGVLYNSGSGSINITSSDLSGNTALSNGGAIDHRGSGVMTIAESTINENTAKLGGAIHATRKGAVNVKATTIDGNEASEFGGAVYATGSGNVVISDGSVLSNNTAPNGGAIYEDTGASVTVDTAALESNKATNGDGGAILIADSSDEGTAATKLTLNNATFKNNNAYNKGGAISTDTVSPNLIIDANNSVFASNTTTKAGGGAFEIQNQNCNSATDPTAVNIVFTGCTFTDNIAKTTGGIGEIRTNSCAKFDDITATGNSSTGNGGGIYVTSNFSRLYLTGDVVASNNISKEVGTTTENFIHLYNSGYSNPPRIYTTHSSDAAWYSQVGGNTTSVTFDLVTLP